MAGNWQIAKAMMRALANKGKGKGGEIEKAAQSRFKKDINAAAAGNDEATHRAAQEWQGEIEGEIMNKEARTRAEQQAADMPGNYEKNKRDIEHFEYNDIEDKATDKALEDAFNEGFDAAAENHGYKKWREESKDMPLNDGFGGDLHDVNREDAVQRSREEIIKALQQNTDRDVTDVLRDFGYIFEE